VRDTIVATWVGSAILAFRVVTVVLKTYTNVRLVVVFFHIRTCDPKMARRQAGAPTDPLGRLEDGVTVAVGDRYDILPTYRVGGPQGAGTGGWVWVD
jgi:hypothetical protein